MGRSYRRGDPRRDRARQETRLKRQSAKTDNVTYARILFDRERVSSEGTVYDEYLGRTVTTWDELSSEKQADYLTEVG